MRYHLMLVTFLAASLSNATLALAHFGLADGDDVGTGLFWVWGVFLAGIVGFFVYKKWWASDEQPERRALKRRLGELERALSSCQSQLQNAKDYPNECGLSEEQRRERLTTVMSIQGLIDKTKAELAAPEIELVQNQ